MAWARRGSLLSSKGPDSFTTILSIGQCCGKGDWQAGIVAVHPLAGLISHRFPLTDGVDAYWRLAAREEGMAKVVLVL